VPLLLLSLHSLLPHHLPLMLLPAGETIFNANCAMYRAGGQNVMPDAPEKIVEKEGALDQYLPGARSTKSIIIQVRNGKKRTRHACRIQYVIAAAEAVPNTVRYCSCRRGRLGLIHGSMLALHKRHIPM
jgi:hypothetical protein